MTYLQAFRHVAMRAMLVLASWSFLLCAVLGLLGYFSGSATSADLERLAILFAVSFVVGYLALMAFAIPAYLWCARRARIAWPYVLLIGATPGVAALLMRATLLGLLLLVSGVVVAFATHWWVSRDLSAEGPQGTLGVRDASHR